MIFEVALGNPNSLGSDSNDDSKTLNVTYQNAYNEDKSGNFQVAIKYLKKAAKSATNKADIYNFMGYSHRKLDLLEEAYLYYEKSLKLDPRHQGANEYIGELYWGPITSKKPRSI
jgi:tetratricopeptide (TPR) repeat protein